MVDSVCHSVSSVQFITELQEEAGPPRGLGCHSERRCRRKKLSKNKRSGHYSETGSNKPRRNLLPATAEGAALACISRITTTHVDVQDRQGEKGKG